MDQLKLVALDAEDLQVISAHVQDAVMCVGDIRHMPSTQTAVFAMNRFVWDKKQDKADRSHERRRAALSFSRVVKMQATGIRQDARDHVLELLAITFEASDAPGGFIQLDFAGGATVLLQVECIEAKLADLGAAWTTARRPEHFIG